MKGWESVYQSGKGRGTENDLILCDEVAFCKGFMEYYDKVLAPTLLTTKGRAIFGSTPNGFNDFHILTTRALSNNDWFYSHATSYDNNANEREEIERIKAEINEDRFAQEYMADFRKIEGLVYKEFDRQKHTFVNAPPINEINRIIGIDFGWTNPTAILTIIVDNDNNYWITDEYYKTQKTIEEIIQYTKTLRGNAIYPDPAEPDRIQKLKDAGFNVQDVSKDIDFGISCVQKLFRTNKIKISTSCVNLIFELENYRYPDKKPGHNESELPIKENDHLLDAMRYALYNTAPPEDDTAMRLKVVRNRMQSKSMA
jgi:phage terminase large subunit